MSSLIFDTILLVMILEVLLGEDAPELPKVALVSLAAAVANFAIAWAFLGTLGVVLTFGAVVAADALILTIGLWAKPWRVVKTLTAFVALKIAYNGIIKLLGLFFAS